MLSTSKTVTEKSPGNILHETETVGKQRSSDFDEQLEDQFSQEWL